MNFEDFQKAWQSQDASAQVTINAEVLMKEVRRNQQQFQATIFWRDAREVGVAIFLTWYFIQRGLRTDSWTDCLVGLTCFGVGAFMVVDRLLQRKKQPLASDSLLVCVQTSLLQVNHQIWLLKNIFWWYLLPLSAALGVSVAVTCWHELDRASQLAGWCGYAVVCILLDWFLYWLNQTAVKKSLVPRRRELEVLLAETGNPVPTSTKP
jgi:Na+/proline symporter